MIKFHKKINNILMYLMIDTIKSKSEIKLEKFKIF